MNRRHFVVGPVFAPLGFMSVVPFRDLPISTRDVFAADGKSEKVQTVSCPHRNGSISVEDCTSCPFVRAIESDVVICARASSASAEAVAHFADPRTDMTEAAARIALREIVPPNVTCVRADASIQQASALMLDRGLRCLPVVDADDRLIGIVSKADLVRDHVQSGTTRIALRLNDALHVEPIARPVSEIMTNRVHALPEDAPIAFAISLLAFESLHEIPVVDVEGRVIGVATALDVLRWVATRMGYVLNRESSPT
ncbi:MAG: CBS domain-containing protein [Polyangiaceae bacterium]